MNFTPIQSISEALLQEGLLLYPYRLSAIKNRFRWTFGNLYPESYCRRNPEERQEFQLECIVVIPAEARLELRLRFLVLKEEKPQDEHVTSTELILSETNQPSGELEFTRVEARGSFHWTAVKIAPGAFKICCLARCETLGDFQTREEALSHALISAHFLAGVAPGHFISCISPPGRWAQDVSECSNAGVWPFVCGTLEAPEFLVASSIILQDYPQLASESLLDLCDSTEIDEMLALRIKTLSPAEKEEINTHGDARAREMLERMDHLSELEMSQLHGTWRPELKKGARVRIHPEHGGDIMDVCLVNRVAIVQQIETNMEGQRLVAVVIEDDPGMDLGLEGKPGHRFFFRPEELEVL